MSETYVKNKILEVQKKLSCSDVLSVKEEIKLAIASQKRELDYDDRLMLWQIYYKKKIERRTKLLGCYLFLSIVVELLVSNCGNLSNWINIKSMIAVWLLLPVLIYTFCKIRTKYNSQPRNILARKILAAYFSDNVDGKIKNP